MSLVLSSLDSIGDGVEQPYGAMIPERVLQELLKEGLELVKTNLDLIDDLFHKLDQQSINDIKAFFSGHDIAVRINFPKDDLVFPMVAILAASEAEDVNLDLLGDYFTSNLDQARTVNSQIIGHAQRCEYQLFCLAGKDSNAPLWLYYVVKAILVVNIPMLISQGLHNVTLSGRDIELREGLFPEMIYARSLSLSCASYFSVRITEKVASKLAVSVFTESAENVTLTLED